MAGWHSSSRTPNALGAAFLFFLMMLMPQGVLGGAALSSGVGKGRQSQRELGAWGGAAAALGHTHSPTFGHMGTPSEKQLECRGLMGNYILREGLRDEGVYS